MNLLLDTHVLLWGLAAPERLAPAARQRMEDTRSVLHFSVASIWEIALKQNQRAIGDARQIRKELLRQGYRELPITSDHVLLTPTLPQIHKDPIDRILLAQAKFEGFTLLTADAVLAQYPGPVERV